MSENEKIEALRGLLPRKRSRQYYAEQLDMQLDEVERLIKVIRSTQDDVDADLTIEGETHEYNLDKGTYKFEAYFDHPPTAEEIIKSHNIDLTKYELSCFYSKGKGSKGWLATALFRNVSKKQVTENNFDTFLRGYNTKYQPLSKKDILINDVYARDCSAFLDLTDFHLDKLGLTGETIEQREECFYSIVNKLLFKSYKAHKLKEIVFVVGSDFMHTDSLQNTTTRGTPLEVLVDSFQSYEIAFRMYSTVINKIKQFCETLKVVLVAGNHGRTKEFYLAHSLSKYFETDSNITFDITPVNRKVYIFGETFIGLHHGNCKIDELPLIFAKEFRQQWGQCKYHEIKVGDKHFYFEKEVKGVRIKQLPALADTDRWHDDSNYVQNIRAAVCTIYDQEYGKVTEFEERI